MTLDYLTEEAGEVYCRINDGKELPIRVTGGAKGQIQSVKVPIVLKKGKNVICLSNAATWCPEIDRMTLEPERSK